MSVFRVEKNKGYTVMSNHHLRNHALSLKAKGLLSQMLSLPEDWDYTLQGLAQINKESIDAIREALTLITDRPVLAGVIGPFSLAGRLVSVTESMLYCYDEPDMMHTVLEKTTEFITKYILAYKAVGAHGVVIAEPLAGLLSPALAQEFSGDYCKRIVDAVKDEGFAVVYHNCGNTANVTLDSIFSCGANAYHFGNAVKMEEIMEKAPSNIICMGNVSPAEQFRGGTPESVRAATLDVMEKCCKYPNFVISSGCDIPPLSSWDNIDAFFAAVDEFYHR